MAELMTDRMDKLEKQIKDISRVLEAHAETHKTTFNSRLDNLENQIALIVKVINQGLPEKKPEEKPVEIRDIDMVWNTRDAVKIVKEKSRALISALDCMRYFESLGYVSIAFKGGKSSAIRFYPLQKGIDEGVVCKPSTYGIAITKKGIDMLIKYVKSSDFQ